MDVWSEHSPPAVENLSNIWGGGESGTTRGADSQLSLDGNLWADTPRHEDVALPEEENSTLASPSIPVESLDESPNLWHSSGDSALPHINSPVSTPQAEGGEDGALYAPPALIEEISSSPFDKEDVPEPSDTPSDLPEDAPDVLAAVSDSDPLDDTVYNSHTSELETPEAPNSETDPVHHELPESPRDSISLETPASEPSETPETTGSTQSLESSEIEPVETITDGADSNDVPEGSVHIEEPETPQAENGLAEDEDDFGDFTEESVVVESEVPHDLCFPKPVVESVKGIYSGVSSLKTTDSESKSETTSGSLLDLVVPSSPMTARKIFNEITLPTRQFICLESKPDPVVRWNGSAIDHEMRTIVGHWESANRASARSKFFRPGQRQFQNRQTYLPRKPSYSSTKTVPPQPIPVASQPVAAQSVSTHQSPNSIPLRVDSPDIRTPSPSTHSPDSIPLRVHSPDIRMPSPSVHSPDSIPLPVQLPDNRTPSLSPSASARSPSPVTSGGSPRTGVPDLLGASPLPSRPLHSRVPTVSSPVTSLSEVFVPNILKPMHTGSSIASADHPPFAFSSPPVTPMISEVSPRPSTHMPTLESSVSSLPQSADDIVDLDFGEFSGGGASPDSTVPSPVLQEPAEVSDHRKILGSIEPVPRQRSVSPSNPDMRLGPVALSKRQEKDKEEQQIDAIVRKLPDLSFLLG